MARLEHKAGRKSAYVQSLRCPAWLEVCSLVRIRDGHKCQMCGKNYTLEVHHKTYFANGASIVGSERDHLDCLVTLCAACHSKIHNK